jgi:predicted nuclease of restriction endonuclease-like (RecB) superfamily
MDFNQLSEVLKRTSEELVQRSVKAVNVNLTVRNWLFGYYIVEYEQNGDDRAMYGKRLLQNLAQEICIKGLTVSELSRCRQFYLVYPEILGTLSQKFKGLLPSEILGSMTQESGSSQNGYKSEYFEQLIINIPYSHFIELIKIDDSIKRSFYELLILKTVPSVRELRRQIETLSYERLGLSADKETTWFSMQDKLKPVSGNDLVKSHYFFEFLNINNPELIEESELELGLISHLQEFIIELGNGFCFEARQKRILIGDEYFFIDLVFYHRILKCHVLIELKTEWVKHEHIGQLKVYLQHYKRTMRAPDDNPPVGILLVTGKNKTLVEYAVADADKEIFVSRYQLQLPDKKELERFIREEMRKL